MIRLGFAKADAAGMIDAADMADAATSVNAGFAAAAARQRA